MIRIYVSADRWRAAELPAFIAEFAQLSHAGLVSNRQQRHSRVRIRSGRASEKHRLAAFEVPLCFTKRFSQRLGELFIQHGKNRKRGIPHTLVRKKPWAHLFVVVVRKGRRPRTRFHVALATKLRVMGLEKT